MKVRGDFLGPPRSTDKTTLIFKVSKGAKNRNRYNQVRHLNQMPTLRAIDYARKTDLYSHPDFHSTLS